MGINKIHTRYCVRQRNLQLFWQPWPAADIKSVLQFFCKYQTNEYQWDVLNLAEGFESMQKQHLHYPGPTLLASNSRLNKYGYEQRFIDKSCWIQPRWRKLEMKYCYAEKLWCPIARDVQKWFVPPEQVCSLISLLMLSLLLGFVSALLSPRNTQAAPAKSKVITYNKEMTAQRVKTNLGVWYSDSAPSLTCIRKAY